MDPDTELVVGDEWATIEAVPAEVAPPVGWWGERLRTDRAQSPVDVITSVHATMQSSDPEFDQGERSSEHGCEQ